MVRDTAILSLTWLAVLCGASFLMLAETLPVTPSFVNADTLFAALAELELFFILIVWPLFILRETDCDERRRMILAAAQTAMLFVLALPLMLIGKTISGVSMGVFLTTHAALISIAAAVSTLFHYGALRRIDLAPGYYFVVFILSAGLPFLVYLLTAERGSPSMTLASLSPFWGMLLMQDESHSGVWLVQTLPAAGLALLTITLAWLSSRRSGRKETCRPQAS